MVSETDDLVGALQETVDRAQRSSLYAERLRDVRIGSLDDFRALPLTTREDLQEAGLDGTRAAPLEEICHYGETSGTTGLPNTTWLTASDLDRSARAITARHPDVFAPGRILLNRFHFMAAPAHLIQLIAQQGGGVSIPAGNINWDVPFPRALELAQRTRASVLAGLPIEPIVLGEIARARGLDPVKDLALDTFFLGGAALPPVVQRRIEKIWGGRVIELYGSTETMLLGTSCAARSLHLETSLVHCEVLKLDSNEPVEVGEVGRFVATTLGLEGSPLVRLDTNDRVRLLPPCSCGDPRPSIVVLGRAGDTVDLLGRSFYSYDLIEAAASAADAVDSSIFFIVVLPDRLLVRIEGSPGSGDPHGVLREHLGDLPIEVEFSGPCTLLDIEQLSRSPSVYKPTLISDWRRTERPLLSVNEGMMEWPRLSFDELRRWAGRSVRATLRRRRLRRDARVAKGPGR